MLETGSLGNLKRDELYGALFQSIDQQFGDAGKSLGEQIELFFSKTTMMTLVVTFRMSRNRGGLLKNLTPELRDYILGILEEAEKKAKQDPEALEKRERDGRGSTIGDK